MRRRRILCVPVFVLTSAVGWAQDAEKLAPYYPTPDSIVVKMLELGGLKPGEKMFDLGSGDGRIVIAAAQKFHAEAVGVELDKDLCRQSLERIRKLGLEKTAQIVNGDILKQDYSTADLIPYICCRIQTIRCSPCWERQLKKGARVVAHDFEFGAGRRKRSKTSRTTGRGAAIHFICTGITVQ